MPTGHFEVSEIKYGWVPERGCECWYRTYQWVDGK